jgi:hypothetical protein
MGGIAGLTAPGLEARDWVGAMSRALTREMRAAARGSAIARIPECCPS